MMLLCFLGVLQRRVNRPRSSRRQGRASAEEKLVAAEETRSGAGGDHAKMPTWHGGGAGRRTARSLLFHPHSRIPLHPKGTTEGSRTPPPQSSLRRPEPEELWPAADTRL